MAILKIKGEFIMKVLIVSKTEIRKQNSRCVGGLLIDSGNFVRLLDEFAQNQSSDTPFEVGQIWDIEFKRGNNLIPPHIEDVLINSKYYIKQIDISNIHQILERLKIKVWYGKPVNLFDGYLRWQGDEMLRGYINHQNGIAKNSVGFWKLDRDLYLDTELENGRCKYNYFDGEQTYSIRYVGEIKQEPIKKISKNTLCRVSLSKWWNTNGQTENRCYLQLSGFYSV